MPDWDNTGRDYTVVVVRNVFYERTVDFQTIERELSKICERRVASSKVVFGSKTVTIDCELVATQASPGYRLDLSDFNARRDKIVSIRPNVEAGAISRATH